ncbi:DUF1624 domain-containing protein [Planktothrix sp. FACHB-1355]|uniref:DUF1624 domain-containing protein n=1 Tax=Aerosakkonema funiforme FACHB-1375 TaxID=2949571 RepID=A0A926V9A8_9CYAN|nr:MULTISPECIES: heparan-alpha-glucosaminide N-acetyltransferase domain-containing protein [Oscillatoriales]MBD2179656.1 DUF1624 domain-containing protein [Aerosakkonema funiforme FACHB-1375]MBD3557955.1 DUF1624 domain-containing protein [Planktothrix sp. FACHB-1355]
MRLISLDVFRGIAIAGMILVNMAGVADKVYPFLEHADWNGCTFADLVFPFFLFIVGVAMAFSLSKYTKTKHPTASVYRRIITRSLILFLLGLLLNGFWNYDLSNIRIMGVLQRISLAYLLAAIAILNLPRKAIWALILLILIGYWAAMIYIPVPDYGAGVLTREGNFGAYVDRLIIPAAHLYKGDNFNSMGDPEGLFSTLPAVATTLVGYLTGKWLRDEPITTRTSINLALIGIICLVLGWDWGFFFPINKKLWTSSYVLYSVGAAMLLLAACYELIEIRELRRWGKPFEVLGLNAIFIFVASVLAIKIMVKTHIGTGDNAPTTYNWIYEHLFGGGMNGSLLFATVTLLFWLAIAYLMYWRRWFIKV